MIRLTLFLLIATLSACRSQKSDVPTSEGLSFLDSLAATDYLLHGDQDGYYDLMSPAHMSIQARDTVTYPSIDVHRAAYLATMRSHVMPWSSEEVVLMQSLMDTARILVEQLNPALWPDNIKMIKVDPVHYGNTVYYTLGDAIVWPANIFKAFTIDGQLLVALHEVWHLLSRDHPSLKDSLYGEIGFYRHGYDIDMGPTLSQRLLVNPDGVTMDHAIRLTDPKGDRSVEAIPLIASRFADYRPSMPEFFAYLHFDLHELKVRSGKAYVEVNDDGTSQMDPVFFPSFFEQIEDNTQYIIHPDEICADNFVLAVKQAGDSQMPPLSEEGKQLLDRIARHLSTFKK
jgi:hypothetical protein